MKRNSQQGVALVITLILLSVITFMAVTFLVVSRKEAAQVNTLTQQSNAKFGADAANAEATAQIVAQMLASGNGLNFGLLVSTNFLSGTNYDNQNNVTALTNVTYSGITSTADLFQMLNNQLILPRAPVFIVTNKLVPNRPDFRFYLDLNRNGRYDTNGLVLEVDTNNQPILDSKNNQVFTIRIGDPEWVGILNHPDQRHSSSNFYIARYCFIALPIGNSLDLNFIHNQAKQISPTSEGFLRNQGVGSWEINLAGFLHQLNPNYWGGYVYVTNNYGGGGVAFSSTGNSFLDAASIVRYRYNSDYGNLRSFKTMFAGNPNAPNLFGNDFIDGYSYGPLMTGLFQTTDPENSFGTLVSKPWSGDNNPTLPFTSQDLFSSAIPTVPGNFVFDLTSAGQGRATDDRYTYYRLLSQLSFASAPESSVANNTIITAPYPGYYPYANRLNLNYCNVGTTNGTNFQPWDPLQFFTNCANRLLANAGYTNTVSNIPIYPAYTNIYTPALHRLLQLAANIYDASTYKTNFGTNFDYPSVFRPIFNTKPIPGGTMVYISGYTNDPPDLSPTAAYNNVPFSLPEDLSTIISKTASPVDPKLNIYGIPWVIGARTGFPNFNEFSMATVSQITRKLQVLLAPSPNPNTNVQYTIGVSNVLGIEVWNSYATTYPRQIQIMGVATLSMVLSNLQSGTLPAAMLAQTNLNGSFSMFFGKANPIVIPSNSWVGFTRPNFADFDSNSFKLPLLTNVLFVPDSVYHPFASQVLSQGGTNFDNTGPNAPAPHFILNVTNRMQFAMVDPTGRVIDYVSFGGLNFTRDLSSELQGNDNGGAGGVWLTNFQNNIIAGIQNQLSISEGINVGNFLDTDWYADQLQPTSKSAATTAFSAFLTHSGSISNAMQAPYTPTRKVAKYYTWQANDPLVHYDLGLVQYDLALSGLINTNLTNQDIGLLSYPLAQSNSTVYLPNLRHVNTNYYPWGNTGNLLGARADPANAQNMAIKDSMITRSDAWQFPTNRFPNIGWLGRVHRGTPWQTVYLKSAMPNFSITNWQRWTVNTYTNQFVTNTTQAPYNVDATLSVPTNDWTILDLFTTAPDDNASRGQLSVNQTNIAAWAALLDGVMVLSNTPAGLTNMFIDPNTNYAAFNYIFTNINAYRASYPGGVFSSVGQILSTPALTVQSPYVGSNPSDMVYERIPQQIMSLLRVGSPRYVIFAYGQSLQPADHSIVQNGSFFGMCTNYQITGEVGTRTVLRIDNPPILGRAATSPKAIIESFNVLPPE